MEVKRNRGVLKQTLGSGGRETTVARLRMIYNSLCQKEI